MLSPVVQRACTDLSLLSAHFSWTKMPAIPPGPEFRYLYVHHAAKSTFQLCSSRGTLPTAWAQSKPTRHPFANESTWTRSVSESSNAGEQVALTWSSPWRGPPL